MTIPKPKKSEMQEIQGVVNLGNNVLFKMNVLLAGQKRIVNEHILSLKQINSWVPEILLGLLNRETDRK